MPTPARRQPNLLAEGGEALALGAWEDARRCFEAALEQGDDPAAREGLGTAAEWLADYAVMFDCRERAFRGYREAGRPADAGRLAIQLTWDYRVFRGELAVANGWLQTAHRMLDGLDTVPEQGWLALREASMLLGGGRLEATRELTTGARELGRALRDPDIELSAVALEGLALVNEGLVAEGLSCLDSVAAAIVGGEMHDLAAISAACCYLIFACERVRDFERAGQWCERLAEFSERYRSRPLFAICRTHYAGVLMSRGRWADAEDELAQATPELEAHATGMLADNIAATAELRRRQGRLDEAEELFASIEHRADGQLGYAVLALHRGDHRAASDHAERYLRDVGDEARTRRAAGLEVLARAAAALGDATAARVATDELDAIAESVGTDPLRGSAAAARGMVAAAGGDLEAARRALEDAVVLFARSAVPYETALARLELAGVLRAADRADAATREAGLALASFQELGAQADAERAAALALAQATRDAVDAAAESPLTRRELEVLRLVAEGLTDPQIATRLFISEHTVHRHVGNILAKLSCPSRAAAVARAAALALL
jgi:LuxR family maltose regulon positive regulatory protein